MSEILGALFAVMVGLMYMPQLTHGLAKQRQAMNDVATAQQQEEWVAAVSSYVQQNTTTYLSTANATAPIIIPVATVMAANVGLPVGFSGTNPFNQTWQAAVLQPTAGTLQVLVYTSGGTAISDQELGLIARASDGMGGMIPSNTSGAYPGGAANAYGTYGAWKIATAPYAVTAGSPASLMMFSNGSLTSNYLYRTAVPGQPQLNQMQTDLGMTDAGGTAHNINNANQISTQTLKALADGSAAAPSVQLANGHVLAYNQVGEGGVLGLTGTNGQIIYLENVNGRFRMLNSSWTAEIYSMDQSGNVGITGNANVAGTMTAPTVNFNTTAANCSYNQVTMRGNNQMFVCSVNNTWVPISNLVGNITTVQKGMGFYDGWTVPKPTCNGGTPTAMIIPQIQATNVTMNPPWQTTVYKLNDTGATWTVQISMQDAAGTWWSGNSMGLTAEVDTQCTFPNNA